MKRTKINSCLLIISLFLLYFNNIHIKQTLADPLAPFLPSFGGFLVLDNSSYSMPNANVLIEIDATNPNSHFDLYFMGNYTIYNPNNSTNVTIAAPFSPEMFGMNQSTILDILDEKGTNSDPVPIEIPGLNSHCTIKINDSVIPYEIFAYFPGFDFPWRDILLIYLLFNTTFPKNSTLVLEYSFSSYLTTPSQYYYYEIDFIYVVGTSRMWYGNITETVDFRVKGHQPDHVYGVRREPDFISTENYTISNIENGKSYLWEWNNVRIYEDYITLRYDNHFENDAIPFGNYFLIFTLIGIALLITHQKFKLDLKK